MGPSPPNSDSDVGYVPFNQDQTAFLDAELGQFGLTPIDFDILDELGYSPTDAAVVVALVSGRSERSPDECRQSIERCLKSGLVQRCDDASLRRMFDIVCSAFPIGPVNVFPRCGDLDFTEGGSVAYQRICRGLRDRRPKKQPIVEDGRVFSTIVRQQEVNYFADDRDARAFISALDLVGETVTSIRMVESEPWRRQWWEPLLEGCKVIVATSNPTDPIFKFWRASHVAIGLERSEDRIELGPKLEEQARAAGRHGISWSEWCVLRHLGAEGFASSGQVAMGAVSANSGNGLAELSYDECLQALDSCIHQGWVWKLDGAAMERIKRHLSSSTPATLLRPIPESRDDVVTLSFDGAERFRSIFEAAFGKAPTFDFWRYEHHRFPGGSHGEYGHLIEQQVVEYYALSEQRASDCGVNDDGLFSDQVVGERVHRRSEPEAIGPWCVNWWKGFPAGWRVEVEFHRSQNQQHE